MFRIILSIAMAGVFCVLAFAQTTEFTYQGNLKVGPSPTLTTVNYDLEFRLCNSETAGCATAPGLIDTNTHLNVPVTDGIFTVKLNFTATNAFDGSPRWLEISVRPAGGGAYTLLTPRQQLTSTPYAIKSKSADTSTNSQQLGGVAASQYLQTNGNGSGLTNLNAGNVTTGTLAIANGGTGSATKNFVDLSTDQTTIGGNKTFTGNLAVIGNLGVGTVPGFKLDVLGRSRFRQNFNVTGENGSAGFWLYQNTTPGSDRAFIGMESDDRVGFYGNQGGGWGLVMNTLSGNVGIGTTTPAGRFHINVPGSGNPISALTLDVGTFGTGANAVNSYFFKVRDLGLGGTPAFLIRGDGNVGIGTNTPAQKLDISGTGIIRANVNSDSNAGLGLSLNNQMRWSLATTSGGAFQIFNQVNPSNALWIDHTNNHVGIGTTAPAEKLDVAGNIKFSGTITGDGSGLTNVTADTTEKLRLVGSLRWDVLRRTYVYPVGNSPAGVAFDGANIWVTNSVSDSVTKIRARDGVNLGSFPAGDNPHGIVSDGANIWVTNRSPANSVTKLRAADGAILGTFTVGSDPISIAFDGSNVWTANGGAGVTKLRASDGANLGTFPTGGSTPSGIAYDGANIWVKNSAGGSPSVTKLRISDGAILGTFLVGSGIGSVAFDGTNIWVANFGGQSISILRPSDGALLGTLGGAGPNPLGMAFDGVSSMWVTNKNHGTVTKVRITDGAPLGTFQVGTGPVSVVFDGISMWVVNELTNNVTKLPPFP